MKTLGLDIGTTSISAVVYSTEAKVLCARTVKNDSFLPGEPWERLQDPQIIYDTAMSLVHELLQEHPDVQAIGITGQMHGILYVDLSGNAVSPLYIWQDGRGDLPHPEGGSWAEALSRITGYSLATGYGTVTHAYNLHHGLVPKEAVTFCTIQDYLAMKLSGRTCPVTDLTDAASLGMFDLQNRCFDEAAFQKAGIHPAMVPEVVDHPLLGCGALGIPVYAAIGDNQASFLGATGGRTDVLLVNMGTGGQVSVYSPEYLQTETLETRPFPDSGWLLVGASLCGGRSYALLENFFRQTVKMLTGTEVSAYEAMERELDEARNVTNLPKVSTLFQGTRSDPTQKGSITELTADNFTPLHLMLGLMQGMADELYQMYLGYRNKGGQAPAAMIGSGNGLRRNRHLRRIFEETFSCPLILSENQEEAACGAAIYAANHCNTNS